MSIAQPTLPVVTPGEAQTPLWDQVRALRVLHADDAPYPGTLCAGEPPRVCVDAGVVPDALWGAATGGHLLAAWDTVLTPAGVGALLPHCPQRLGALIGTAPALRTGQVVTVAVSVLRAAGEALGLEAQAGTWWVDTTGRPLLALGGDEPWAPAALRMLEDLADQCPAAAKACAAVAEVLASPDLLVRRTADLEDQLFALAEPAPLGLTAAGPGVLESRAQTRSAARAAGGRAAPSWLMPWMETGVLARISEAWEITRSAAGRLRPRRPQRLPPSPRRVRPWQLALVIGVLVVVGGALWPDGPGQADAAPPPSRAPAAATPSAGEALPEASAEALPDAEALPSVGAVEGWALRTRELLHGARECSAGEREACGDVLENVDAPAPTGLAAHPEEISEVTLLDEFGGVAVVRLDAEGFTPQTVVLIDTGQKWLIREVFDLADQR